MSTKVKTSTKTTAAGAGVGAVTTYAAVIASQKWGVPVEVAAVVVSGIFAFVSRWAGKLLP